MYLHEYSTLHICAHRQQQQGMSWRLPWWTEDGKGVARSFGAQGEYSQWSPLTEITNLKLQIKVKVNCSRYRPGLAQRVGRGIVLLLHGRGTSRGWVVSSTARPHFTPAKDPVPIVKEAGWAPGPVLTGGKSCPHRDSIPDRPVRSQSIYRLSYLAHIKITNIYWISSHFVHKFKKYWAQEIKHLHLHHLFWRPLWSPLNSDARGSSIILPPPATTLVGKVDDAPF